MLESFIFGKYFTALPPSKDVILGGLLLSLPMVFLTVELLFREDENVCGHNLDRCG